MCKRSWGWYFAPSRFPALFGAGLCVFDPFLRAWALAVIKSEKLEEMRHCAGTGNTLINNEIALHIKTCADVGITDDALFNEQER